MTYHNGRPLKGQRVKSWGNAGARLYLPQELTRLVPPDDLFIPEMVEEGILFRRQVPETPARPPSWALTPAAGGVASPPAATDHREGDTDGR